MFQSPDRKDRHQSMWPHCDVYLNIDYRHCNFRLYTGSPIIVMFACREYIIFDCREMPDEAGGFFYQPHMFICHPQASAPFYMAKIIARNSIGSS